MTYTIAHITDLHIPSPQKFEQGDKNIKRMLGHLSWERNRKTKHLAKVLDALREDLKELDPDYICITGDQTNLGLHNEFVASEKWIDDLGVSEKRISVIPGNHDAYGPGFKQNFKKFWGKWMKSDDGVKEYPYIRRTGPVAIIGLSSAIRTLPFSAKGAISKEQFKRLEQVLKKIGEEELPRIILCHHPIQKGAAKRRKSLWFSKKIRNLLAKEGCELVLHGHNHKIHHDMIDGPNGSIPVLGAGSASYCSSGKKHTGHYQIIAVDDKDFKKSKIMHRHYDRDEGKYTKGETVSLYPQIEQPATKDEEIDV